MIKWLKKNDPARKIFTLETGARFREFIKGKNYSHELSRKIYESGGLQPEFLVISIWSAAFIEGLQSNEHIVLDGTPRRPAEAPILDSAFKFYGRVKPHLVYLNVSREWAEARLAGRKRADDKASEVKARLDWFDTEVAKTIDFFRNNPDYEFLDVNGEQTVQNVHEDILKNLEL